MKNIFVLLIFLISFTAFGQGLLDGYNKGKGNLDIAISGTYQSSQKFLTVNGSVNIPRQMTSLGVFAAYGIAKKWDVVANIPMVNWSFQDAGIGTKYRVVDTKISGKSFHLFPAITVQFPMSNYVTQSAQAIGQRTTVISPRVIVQQQLPGKLFIQLQGGYNFAISPVVSSVPFSAKVGGSYGKFYFDVWYDFQHSFGGVNYPTSSDFRGLGVDHHRVGGVFYYQPISKLGLLVNYSYTLAGRNTGQAYGVGVGLVVKLNLLKKKKEEKKG